MATQETVRPQSSGGGIVTAIVCIGFVVMIAIMVATFVGYNPFQQGATTAPPLQSTAAVARPPAQPARPIVAPALPGVAQNEATATALYNQAVREAAPVPNTNPAPAPAVLVSKPSAREGAGESVPTSLPLHQGESGGIFGSKPAIVAPQETHECKHGQVWTARGCKNPTPTR